METRRAAGRQPSEDISAGTRFATEGDVIDRANADSTQRHTDSRRDHTFRSPFCELSVRAKTQQTDDEEDAAEDQENSTGLGDDVQLR